MNWIRLALTITFAVAAQAAFGRTLPNMLLILVDDLGYGDLRCYNADSKVAALRIDRREDFLFRY